MNETTRDRNGLPSDGTRSRTNVELETTTTTIEQNPSQPASERDGAPQKASERAKAEAQQVRERAAHAGEQARRTAAETSEQMRRKTRETAELVRERAAEQAAIVKQQAVEQIDCQKNGLAAKICDVSGALKRAAEDLDQHNDSQLAGQARRLAEGIEGIGSHLRDSQIRDLMEDAEHFVRRHPAATLGGLFVAGLTIARFLKASPPRYQSATAPQSGTHPWSGDQPNTGAASGGTNPYLQRQVGTTPRPMQDRELTVGSSDLKIGSTDPTHPHPSPNRPSSPPMASATTGSATTGSATTGSSPAGSAPMGSRPGATGSLGATNPLVSGGSQSAPTSPACPTPNQAEKKSPESNSGNSTPGGSPPRLR